MAQPVTRYKIIKAHLRIQDIIWLCIHHTQGECWMPMQRVQMLLEPKQRIKLAALAQAHGKSLAEITRMAIDAGLEKLAQNEQQVRMNAALKAAQQLRDSMPLLSMDVVADLHQMRGERDNELFSRD
ncbi:MAG: hypothetical protein Q7U74_12885 [Saprospiraceae bacterium]|nr:hypothetical protein [Saprospiraceae bacterium]